MLLRQSFQKVVAHGHHHLECRGVAINTQLGIGPVASSLPVMGSAWIGTATAISAWAATALSPTRIPMAGVLGRLSHSKK